MPGMMDTVFNLGLNDETVETIAKVRRSALRLRQLSPFHYDVLGCGAWRRPRAFRGILDRHKEQQGYKLDTDLSADDWADLVVRYKKRVKDELGQDFPQNPHEQLWGASARCLGMDEPTRYHISQAAQYSGKWGTAVNVQAMVFGNMGDTSATGVAFTRNPSTGEKKLYGEFLINAQGEDVVAGIRTPQEISEAARKEAGSDKPSMEYALPKAYAELKRIYNVLERHYRDMQDLELQSNKASCGCCRRDPASARPRPRFASRLNWPTRG